MAKADRGSRRRPGQAGIDALTELTLNLRSAWHHGTDRLWAELEPELWALTRNPWVVLQTVSRSKLRQLLARPEYRGQITSLLEQRRDYLASPAWFQQHYPQPPFRHVAYGPGNGYEFGASVPASRAAGDYTIRLVPFHPAALVPLEAPRISWQR